MKIFLIILGSIYLLNTIMASVGSVTYSIKVSDYRAEQHLKRVRPLSIAERIVSTILAVTLVICPIIHIFTMFSLLYTSMDEQRFVKAATQGWVKEGSET